VKKINIVKNNRDFEKIINNKHIYRNQYFSIFVTRNNKGIYHFGISIPKKIGKAYLRNKLKRQIKSIIDNYNEKIDVNYDYIIIVKSDILKINYQAKNDSLIDLFLYISTEEGKK
jgi:ribonuclease P protein component